MKSQMNDDKKCAALAKIGEAANKCAAFNGTFQNKKPMRNTLIKYPLYIIALTCSALAACSQAPQAPPKEIKIQADDKMKFDVTAFEAKPGQKISITLLNVGTTPKFSMGHNCVVLDRNVNVQTFLDAASMAAATDYVPKDFKGVLAHTKLLGPSETDTVQFNAPYVPGEYPFFCSFPGHYSQGTKGVMTVKQ
jgi:azurin